MFLKSFFRRISKDFRKKELLPLKLIFFVHSSTLHVLYPYLTIHMRELGINVKETAIMSAVTPFIAIIMPPLAGMVADRIGNFRILLSFFSALGGLAALLLLLVPIGRITVEFPNRVVMDVDCPGENGEMIYTMNQNHPCKTKLQSIVHTRLESCGYKCHLDHDDVDAYTLLTSRVYTVRHYNLETGLNSSFEYVISPRELPKTIDHKEAMKEHRKLMNDEFYETSIRSLSKNTFFFPANRLYEFSCHVSARVENFEDGITGQRKHENHTLCNFGRLAPPGKDEGKRTNYHTYKSKLKALETMESDILEGHLKYQLGQISWSNREFQKVTCGNPDSENEKILLSVTLHNNSLPTRTITLNNCTKRCIVTAPRKEMCSNMNTEIEYNITLTFWLYLGIRVFIGIIGGTTFAMFEGAVIAILREQKADYGLQRIYGSIGGMISSPLSGFLIEYASRGKSYSNFRPAFYLYAALKIMSGFLMLAINLEFKAPASNVVSDVLTVLGNIEVVALFIACFILGTAWGYIESFLFWLIQDLGGSTSLMGITITVGGIAGIPLLVLSGPIINKIGHANVLFIGFVFYAVRLFGYSIIYNPWYTLVFEAFESVTSSLSFTAAVTYAAKLSTTTTDSSIQGLLGGVYYGVGKGFGSLVGGYLMKAFGTRPTYQIFAVVSLVTGLMYLIFNVTYLKRRPQVEGNDIVKKEPKENVQYRNGIDDIIEIVLEDTMKPPLAPGLKRRITTGVVNDAFSIELENKEKSSDSHETKDIEAINNAKNLSVVEKSSLEEDKDKETQNERRQSQNTVGQSENVRRDSQSKDGEKKSQAGDEGRQSQSEQNQSEQSQSKDDRRQSRSTIEQSSKGEESMCEKSTHDENKSNSKSFDVEKGDDAKTKEQTSLNGQKNPAFEDDEEEECNITPEVLPKDENALSGLC